MRLRVGDVTMLDGYSFRFLALENMKGPNYSGIRGTLEVTLNGKKIDTLYPEKRIYTMQDSAMTEGAIYSSIFRHLYVALGEQVSRDEWIMRIQHKPMVSWIWGGCIIMALGGLLAVSDRRYRLPSTERGRENR